MSMPVNCMTILLMLHVWHIMNNTRSVYARATRKCGPCKHETKYILVVSCYYVYPHLWKWSYSWTIPYKKFPLSNKEMFVYVARATTDQQNVIWKTRTYRKCKKERPNRMSIVIARLSLQEKVILRKYKKRKVHSIYNL